MDVFSLSWKPKWVHLDVICIIHTVFFCSGDIIFETGWALKKLKKKKKNRKNRLSNFYNWLFICILYQWSFLYWKLKKKNLYWKKKLSGLSMWPRLDQVSSSASWWCQAIFFFVVVFCLLSQKMPDFWFLYTFLTWVTGGLGSSNLVVSFMLVLVLSTT